MNDGEGEYIHTWLEHIDTILESRERSADGVGIWFQQERTHYLAACLSTALLDRIVQSVLEEAGVPTFDLPPGVRLRRRGDTCFAFNYSPESRPTPGPGACRLLGTDTLEPGGVAAWRIQE
jgi:beta-galactosidase